MKLRDLDGEADRLDFEIETMNQMLGEILEDEKVDLWLEKEEFKRSEAFENKMMTVVKLGGPTNVWESKEGHGMKMCVSSEA